MTPDDLQTLIEDATFDFTMGDHPDAIAKLDQATLAAPESFAAWHALSEIHLSLKQLDQALIAAERGYALQPNDLFINTTLSRIWVGKGDKEAAEKYGAQAKMLSWKEELKSPPGTPDPLQ